MRVAWLVGLALLGLVATSARCEEWSHRYPLDGPFDLHLRTGDGDVRVEHGAASAVEARVTTSGWRIAPDEVTITGSQTGNHVDIEVQLRKHGFEIAPGPRSIRISLRVPSEGTLDVRTRDGDIDVAGLQGKIRLRSGDGSIRASGLSGELDAHTGDGDLKVSGKFERLDLHSGDGDVDASVEPGSRLATAWSLRSGDGDITLRLPEELSADLDAHTGDGDITLDQPVAVTGTIRDDIVRGRLGSGGPPLRIETGDGSIRLSGL
jgi:hypothetical protein